ncbi:MAG: META domain-containing protein [Chloroflexaceae bacterium]|nr:META domain-containing protein [Chloroflexaceae bacterium]
MKPFLIMGSLLIVLMISVACGNQSPPAATTPAAAPEPTAVTEPAATAPTPAVRSDDTITDTHTLTDTNALTDTNELLIGSVWQWQQFSNPLELLEIPNPEQYTLVFQEDGTLNIQADCNQAIGSYLLDSHMISITVGPMTRAACPPESQSDQMIEYLGQVVIYSITPEDQLLLEMPVDSGTLVFSRSEGAQMSPVPATTPVTGSIDPALLGTIWQWEQFNNAVEVTDIPIPQQYTLMFQDDGNLSVQADCNQAGGTYIADTGSISITMGFMTMAACPPESKSNDFVDYLGQVVIYSITPEGQLLLEMPVDSGTLVFSPLEIVQVEPVEPSQTTPVTPPVAMNTDPALLGTVWQWQQFVSLVAEQEIPTPEQYTLTFQEDGSLNVQADCNQSGGTYIADSGSISITMGFMTMAECGPESLGLELVDYLGQVAVYSFTDDGLLLLELPAANGTLVFGSGAGEQPVEEPSASSIDPALQGTLWQWQKFISPVESRETPTPEQYTLTFQEMVVLSSRPTATRPLAHTLPRAAR